MVSQMNSNALATKLLLTVEPLKTVVQYLGTASASIPFPYGNQQHDDKAYVHLCPSTLQTVKTAVGKDIASNVFKTTVAAADVKSALQPVVIPRNCKQVQNAAYAVEQKTR